MIAETDRASTFTAQNDNLQIHEEKSKGIYVKNLSDFYVSNAREVYEIMRQGGASRVVSSTSKQNPPPAPVRNRDSYLRDCLDMNAESSRSHSIFVITITQRNVETGAQKTGNLYLVDLAGSEKVGKTGASGQTLEEAKKINKSLSALGMVINALTDSKVLFASARILYLNVLSSHSYRPSMSLIEIRNSLAYCKSPSVAIRGQR